MTATRTKDLRDLLDEATASTHAGDSPPAANRALSRPQSGARGHSTDHVSGGGPRYLSYERKEARLTGEQSDALTRLTRALNRARGSEGERLTDNTLIRVAVDLLLARADDLRGRTETELRQSVGL